MQYDDAASITTFRREARASPKLSGTNRDEIDDLDRADCDGTRFAVCLFSEYRGLFFGLSLVLRKCHPFANDFSARVIVFHVRGSLAYPDIRAAQVHSRITL
jgi:hypothetical protein